MPKFYVTYGFGSDLGQCYSVVEAPDMDAARDYVYGATGNQYAFMYPESQYDDAIKRFDLTEVPLRAQRMVR